MNKHPSTGASVLVFENNKVLLIKRGKEPYKGYWSLPGGGHEYGETLEECAARELLEETGLSAKRLEFCKVRDRMTKNENGEIIFHYVLATYQAFETSGEAEAKDDAMDIGWFSLEELSSLQTTPETPNFIAEILEPDFSYAP